MHWGQSRRNVKIESENFLDETFKSKTRWHFSWTDTFVKRKLFKAFFMFEIKTIFVINFSSIITFSCFLMWNISISGFLFLFYPRKSRKKSIKMNFEAITQKPAYNKYVEASLPCLLRLLKPQNRFLFMSSSMTANYFPLRMKP